MANMKCEIPYDNKLLFYKNYLDKKVEIGIVKRRKLYGIFCTFDPVSERVAISDKGNSSITVINSNYITYIKCLDEEPIKNKLFIVDDVQGMDVFNDVKLSMKTWLEKHLFNVQIEGDLLKIDDSCIIKPPYGVKQCVCSDPIKLELIEDVIRQLSQSAL